MKIELNISNIMKEKNMGINTLSHKTGIPVYKLEILLSGKADALRFSSLELLCRALETTPDLLLLERL